MSYPATISPISAAGPLPGIFPDFWNPATDIPHVHGSLLYVLALSDVNPATVHIYAWVSSDQGLTWTVGAQGPAVDNVGLAIPNICVIEDSGVLHVGYKTPITFAAAISSFDMATASWTTTFGSGPTVHEPTNFSDDGGGRVLIAIVPDGSFVAAFPDTYDSVAGCITNRSVNAGGTGYAVGDILTVVQGGNTTGTLKVVNTGALNAITNVRIVNPGAGYTTAVLAVTGGTGAGATFNITASAVNCDRVSFVTCSNVGVWGTPVPLGTYAGTNPDQSLMANGIIVQSQTVQHLFLGYLDGTVGIEAPGGYRLMHTTVTSGVATALDQIADDVWPLQEPQIGYPIYNGASEMVIPYTSLVTFATPTNNHSIVKVARSAIVSSPSWTIEAASTDPLNGPDGNLFQIVGGAGNGTSLTLAWPARDDISFYTSVWTSGSGWAAETLLFTDPSADYERNNAGSVSGTGLGIVFIDYGTRFYRFYFIPGVTTPPLSISTSSTLTHGAYGQSYSVALRGTGGSGIYNWAISAGALPTGLSLNSTTGLISGTIPASPAQCSLSSFTVTLSDSNGDTPATKSFTLGINPYDSSNWAPQDSGAAVFYTLPPAIVGQPYLFGFTPTGCPPLTYSVSSGSLPTGLSLSAGGVISGTPTGISTTPVISITDSGGGTTTLPILAPVTNPTIGDWTLGPDWSLSTLCAREGNFGLRRVADGTISTSDVTSTHTLPVSEGQVYYLSFWASASAVPAANGVISFGFSFYDVDGVFLSSSFIDSVGNPSAWSEFLGTITVPADAVTAVPVVRATGHTTGSWCVDTLYAILAGGYFILSSIKSYYDDYILYR